MTRNLSYRFKLLIIYLIIVTVVFILIYNLFDTFNKANVGNISSNHYKNKTLEREEYLHNFFYPYFTTIRAIQKNKTFKDFITDNKNEKDIQEYFLSIKRSLPYITKVRYIDENGMEKLRVDGTPIGLKKEKSISQIVSRDKLQNKATRYYFKNFLKLEKDEVGLSKIDLNKEHDEITTPKQPTIRIGIVAYDNHNKKNGIVVINIHLQIFFKLLNKSTLYYLHLIDEKGIYLNHHNPKYGLLGDNMKYSIFNEFPRKAKEILENDEYYSENLYALKVKNFNNGQNLKLILEPKFHQESKETIKMQNKFLLSIVLFTIVLLPILIYFTKLPDLLRKKLYNKQEIENKNKFISTLLESIPIPMFYKNLNGKYFDVNQAFSDLIGIGKEQIINKTTYEIFSKEIADRYKQYDDNFINNYHGQTHTHEDYIKNIKTGALHHIIIYKNLFMDIDNKPAGIIGSAIDITEKINIKNKLLQLNDELEDEVTRQISQNLKKEIQLFESSKLASMGAMISHIIHQWRQPLSIISLKASLIEHKANANELIENQELIDKMNSISNLIQRLNKIIDTFRNFLKEKKEFKQINLQEKIEDALVICGSVLYDKGVSLEKNINFENPIYIKTIANELMEVVINLINNSIDIIEEKKIDDGWIKVEVLQNDISAIITIEDNGGGIPENILPKIFNEYFTTKDDSKGTGLGLYMSKKIITESLNGKLFVKNTQNGAKFSIELPL